MSSTVKHIHNNINDNDYDSDTICSESVADSMEDTELEDNESMASDDTKWAPEVANDLRVNTSPVGGDGHELALSDHQNDDNDDSDYESVVWYECNSNGCDKRFQTQRSLTDHLKNHLCGYGIRPVADGELCSDKELRKYYVLLTDSGRTGGRKQLKYQCLWTDCPYVGSAANTRRHVHSVHVCPNRRATKVAAKRSAPIKAKKVITSVAKKRSADGLPAPSQYSSPSDSQHETDGQFDHNYGQSNTSNAKSAPVVAFNDNQIDGQSDGQSSDMSEDSVVDDKPIGKYCCDKNGCDKRYRSRSSLNEHMKNHRCGYGIRPLAGDDICSNAQLSKYWSMVSDKPSRCRCLWSGCPYEGTPHNMARHVHRLHVCPHREIIAKQLKRQLVRKKPKPISAPILVRSVVTKLPINSLPPPTDNGVKITTPITSVVIANSVIVASNSQSSGPPVSVSKSFTDEDKRLLELFDKTYPGILDHNYGRLVDHTNPQSMLISGDKSSLATASRFKSISHYNQV